MAANSQRTESGTDRGRGKKRSGSRVQVYDFVRPTKISEEQRISLSTVSGHLANAIETLLSSLLRMPVDVTAQRAEAMSFQEFAQSAGSPCAAFFFTPGIGGCGEGVIDLGTDLSFYLIDKLFGGSGEVTQQARSLSELEQSVLRRVVDRMLEVLKEVWQEHVQLAPNSGMFAATPEVLSARGRGEVLATRLSLTVGSQECVLAIALPLGALEAFLQHAVSGSPGRTGDSGAQGEYRAVIADDLKHAQMTVAARLPSLVLDARSVANLAVGQVIQTSQHIELPIELYVNECRRYLGTLGQVRRHVGVQITQEVPASPSESSVRTMRGRVM